jgi:hypothetical protein
MPSICEEIIAVPTVLQSKDVGNCYCSKKSLKGERQEREADW